MTLAELIQGVTPEIVSAQAFPYAPRNWASYPDMPECMLAAGYSGPQLEGGFLLSRQSLKDLFGTALERQAETQDRQMLAAAVTLVPVWGYPRGVVGPGNRLPIQAVHTNRVAMATHIAKFAHAPVSMST